MIEGTEENFFELVENEYKDKVGVGKKTLLEMYEYCKTTFAIEQVEKETLDFMAEALFEDFMNMEAKSNKVTIYRVPQSDGMKLYYDSYHNAFHGNGDIYIFVDEENNIWSSTSELFSLYLRIQLGIELKDIQAKNRTYLDYLNYFHCYDFLLYHTK
jgi:hypothetical protein